MTEDGALRIVVYRDGQETDITEGVQALYDLVINSMDWGSGFLSDEDVRPVIEVAEACQFASFAEAREYVARKKHDEECRAFYATLWPPRGGIPSGAWTNNTHDHVYSSVGRCMWPGCDESFKGSADGV